MSWRLRQYFKFDMDQGEFLKVIFLAITFFLIIGAYTLTKELKDAVFTNIVGSDRKYLAYAKIFSMLVFIPTIFLHSKLVDLFKRHQLLYIYSIFFGISGICFAFFLGHSTIGIVNEISNPYRIFGWLFYFFVEGFSPLVVSVYWAFVNSITKPEVASRNYSIMIAGSKIGGILTAGFAWIFLNLRLFSDAINLQFVLLGSSILLLFVPLFIRALVSYVPRKNLHGYEAVYQVEKQLKHEEKVEGKKEPWFKGIASGLILLFKYPYAMGIFGMSFFFEVVNQALKVENIIFGRATSSNLSQFTSFLMWQSLLVHLVGFFVVVFGTRTLLQVLGERSSLMLVPTLTGLSIIGFLVNPSFATAIIAFVVTRSVNYAFAVPLRESLYIPTIKEIKFKTKSWIDSIGTKFAKVSASSFNMYADGLTASVLLGVQTMFFGVTISLWLIVAYLLGRRFEYCVKHNEVIGTSKNEVIGTSKIV